MDLVVNRKKFLEERKKHTAAALKEAEGRDDMIVIDAGDDVVCDACNDLIETDLLRVVHGGAWIVCEKCFPNHKEV